MVCAYVMKNRASLPRAAALFALIVGAAACGSSDDTSGQPGNSTIDSGADGAATGDATTTDGAAPDASGVAPVPDAALDVAAEATVPPVDAGKETSVSAPEPSPEAGPADAASDATLVADAAPDAPPGLDLDACAIPDGGIPDVAINDSGATTASCLACIATSCATQEAACNGDCVCAGDVVTLFACTASGQSAQACLASSAASASFTSLAICVGLACGTPCGVL
jgi:hypothetical protein